MDPGLPKCAKTVFRIVRMRFSKFLVSALELEMVCLGIFVRIDAVKM